MIGTSIRRPVAVTMAYLCLALLGVAAWRGLPVELLPNTEFPRLSVHIQWPGASPETIEAFATSPVEGAIQRIASVENLTSATREGLAVIEVQFARGTRMDFTRVELSERLATVQDELPPGVQPLRISQWIPAELRAQVERPFLSFTLSGPFLLEALQQHLEVEVSPEIVQIPGVAEIVVEGARRRVLEVALDPDRIASLGLSPPDVQRALIAMDIVRDAGSVREGDRELSLKILSRAGSSLDVRRAILPVPSQPGGAGGSVVVRVDDVGVVRDTFEEPRYHYRIQGLPTVRFTVIRAEGVNTVWLADAVKNRISELESRLPPGSQLVLVDDQSEDIHREMTNLRNRAGVAVVVIFLVLVGFLKSLRSAGLIVATIGFSVLIALNVMYYWGLSLNLMTLVGLSLGFGLIVDNAIVVLENIYRRWEEGVLPIDAAERGARDVILPILASTTTTVIIVIPFLYLKGELRILYFPLIVVVGLTLAASILVAFSFIPSLMARVLCRQSAGSFPAGAPGYTKGSVTAAASPGGNILDQLPSYQGKKHPAYLTFYAGLLEASLRFPWITLGVATASLGTSWLLFDAHVTRGSLFGGGWGERRSFIQVTIEMPQGADLERVDDLARYFEERIARMPEVERFITSVHDTRATLMVTFSEALEFTAVPRVIEESLRAEAVTFAGVRVRVLGQGLSFGTAGIGDIPKYSITFLGYNYERLAEIADDFGRRIGEHLRVDEVDTNASAGFFMRDRAIELVARVNREAADRLGVTVQEATRLLQSSLREAGPQGVVTLGEEPVRFEVRLAGYREADVEDLLDTVVSTSAGRPIRLGDFMNIEERQVLTQIRRENQQYERTVTFDFRGPRPLGDLVRDEQIARTVVPPGYSIRERVPWQVSSEELAQIRLVLLVTVGLIFIVTAGFFESIRQPVIVLLAVPMALIGVFLMFAGTGATFTREAYIGVIMMGGIVVNNAILLVDHINRVRRESGLPLDLVVLRGTLERVRPIVMTTTTTVLGLLPLVLFTRNVDATIWNAVTFVLMGGLLSSTLFVLVTVPALYLVLERPSGIRA
jgi:HAE1 family hydrophobic/amphiphilic exporter-1